MSKHITPDLLRPEQHGEKQQRHEKRQRSLRMRHLTLLGIIATAAFVVTLLVSVFRGQTLSSHEWSHSTVSTVYPAIDTVACDDGEHDPYQSYVHLSIYIHGKLTPISPYIGFMPDGSCLYWLHTVSEEGVIEIDAPYAHTFVLGNFLDIWKERFSQFYPKQLDQAAGWQAYVNGKPFAGDFRTIPLQNFALITLAYQSPGVRPDRPFDESGSPE